MYDPQHLHMFIRLAISGKINTYWNVDATGTRTTRVVHDKHCAVWTLAFAESFGKENKKMSDPGIDPPTYGSADKVRNHWATEAYNNYLMGFT